MGDPEPCTCGPADISWNVTGDKNALKGKGVALHRGLAEEFDAWASAGRGAEMETGHRPSAEQALARFPFARMTRFLDVGCGNGYAVRHAARAMPAGSLALGVDLSAAMLRVAATATPRDLRGRTGHLRGAFGWLPFPAASLDGVYSHEAIYYAPNVDLALREMRRVLRPGGTCVIALDYFEENEYSLDWPRACGIPMTLDSESGWRERLGRAGFVHVESARLFGTDTPLPPLAADATPAQARHDGLKRRWLEEEGTLMVMGTARGGEGR